jgi:hypothetical protein
MARGLLGVLACAVALAAPAGATAKPGFFVSGGFFSLTADLPKSNGYTVSLETLGHRSIGIILNRTGETAYYLTKGRVDRNGIEVDFGRFGRLRADFTGHEVETEGVFAGCHGRKPIKFSGRLEGTFRFRGEKGFVTIAVERVKASWEQTFREVCESSSRAGSGDPRLAAFGDEDDVADHLEVSGRDEGRRINLFAIRQDLFPETNVSVSVIERIGKVTALKLASSDPTAGGLTFSPPEVRPRTATLTPSSPFHGGADYKEQTTGPNEWTGDLRVHFPGLGTVALTGPSFRAYACRHSQSQGFRGCRAEERSRYPAFLGLPR